ncbi:Predicted metal-dependent hydrolase, TIM-barrel fold [Ekhidna lutea]|uniref:Predicted metal-dependent hydrolase, TIM-barrel fold n=2 Tax=Ekhidna lutea TaxID=447679 RepID=A0A239LBG1_EKHLU|nr:Predicted metal-dependent hydrolase, TIM-barrel fold [Ekhidna lutea]
MRFDIRIIVIDLKSKSMRKTIFILSLIFSSSLLAQEAEPTMSFEEYNPISTLVVPENPVKRAKFPFVDIHSHQWNLTKERIASLVEEMDELNMGAMVNLSGRGFNREAGDIGSQEYLAGMVRRVEGEAPNRIIVFTNVSFKNIGEDGWTEQAVRELEEDVAAGARGLKIYKSLGLRYEDTEGKRVAIDDPRIDPVWAKCGELGIPVLIHAADPKPFWDDMNADNERWLELKLRPGRKRGPNDPAPFEQIIAEQHNIFKKHPNTTFVNAHMGWMANDLDKAGEHLEMYPNVYFGIGAVIAEFGRQPRRAKAFFEKYQDRLLFGKDAYNPEEFYTYFRVLETEDEYFPYYKKYHAFWRMYGLGLSDEVLKKIYYKNACKIIPGLELSQFEK